MCAPAVECDRGGMATAKNFLKLKSQKSVTNEIGVSHEEKLSFHQSI